MMAVTVTTNQLIDLIDLLQAGSIACEATAMASEALPRAQQDAMTFLARDAQNTIECARDKLEVWLDAAKEGNREGHGNV